MYLSKLRLNLYCKNVRRDIADCYQLHKTIMAAFPSKGKNSTTVRKTFNILYRLNQRPHVGSVTLLVQSAVKPDWTNLPTNYCLKNSGEEAELSTVQTKDITQVLDHLNEGKKFRFRLLANPTKKMGTSTKQERLAGKKKSKGTRVPLIKHQNRIDWLIRKGTLHGFHLIPGTTSTSNLTIQGQQHTIGYKKIPSTSDKSANNGHKRHRLTFYGVLFEGMLQITDKEAFSDVIRHGIGPGKAFGFGLISIARVAQIPYY